MATSSKVIRSITMIMLFASVGSLLSTGIPDAFAMTSPAVGQEPNTPVMGGTMKVVIIAGTNAELDHVKGIVRIYEPNLTVGTGTGDFSKTPPLDVCDFGTTGGTNLGTGRIWEFRQASNTGLANEYTITQTTDSLKIPFGVNGATVTPTKTPGVTLSDNQGVWVQTSESPNPGTMDDTIDFLTDDVGAPYRVATCGYDNEGQAGDKFQYLVNDPFGTQALVGGTIMAIDTTALLIAGISTSQLMILPALGIVAGGAFALLKFQLQRKEQ